MHHALSTRFDPRYSIRLAATTVVLGLTMATASATDVVGGTDLLTATSASQLEAWLGQGTITLTNLFDKSSLSTSQNFHAAVDGKGATFSVFQVLGPLEGAAFAAPILVGGYNPQSWNSSGGNNLTPPGADRTAFVFNLASDVVRRQVAFGTYALDAGAIQTYNSSNYGPAFGNGDLLVYTGLQTVTSQLFSYGVAGDLSRSLVLYPGYDAPAWVVGQLEVFGVTAGALPPVTPAVPEPQTWALMLGGMALLSFAMRRRDRRA